MAIFRLRLVAALVFVSSACTPPPPGELVGSSRQRITAAAPQADLDAAIAGNTDFALDLYRTMTSGKDGNLFISPHSISLALSLAYAGSGGATTAAFEHTLHIGLPQPQYHRAMNDLDRQLRSRGQGAKAADGQPFRLDVANQLFAQKGFTFEQPYLDTLAQEYGAGVRLMDFVAKPDPSRVSINTWVGQVTEGKIKDLLAEGIITSDTRAVLVNAIYFNAAWAKRFDPKSTHPAPFHAIDGTTPSVDMMSDAAMAGRLATVDQVDVVSLPYDGQQLSLVIMMPPQQGLATFEQGLSAAKIGSLVTALHPATLRLTMPKFELRTAESLSTALKSLGLAGAFGEGGDFSTMSKAAQLGISDVVHQAFVKVSESGTEAAAATAVVIGVTSAVAEPNPVVVIDRPFVFAIRDDATGAIVFLGRVVKP